ncbi:hypothetical protein AYI70_g2927 [Smittium culicis]|uniref:Hyaluronan/mRNA-binding protein domain-containing protein n=1 Tax=Smittium culicis TaxID=133412 RepID=A0A1R1Y664_9FUNG|nr:hypothetical protein AYI70_g2927 [Smittium culicis]
MGFKPRRNSARSTDHHLSRNGGDLRALPKKGGNGRNNWGSSEDFSEENSISTSPPAESKLKTISPNDFEIMKHSP